MGLASPSLNPDLFPDFQIALQVEEMFLAQRQATSQNGAIPAQDYITAKDDLNLNLIQLVKTRTQELAGIDPAQEEAILAEQKRLQEEAILAEEKRLQEEALLEEKRKLEAEEEAPKALEAQEAKNDIDDFGDDW